MCAADETTGLDIHSAGKRPQVDANFLVTTQHADGRVKPTLRYSYFALSDGLSIPREKHLHAQTRKSSKNSSTVTQSLKAVNTERVVTMTDLVNNNQSVSRRHVPRSEGG